MRITIQDNGAADMLDRFAEKIKSGLPQGLARAGKIVEGDARAHAPVDTGRLRGSITSQAQGLSCEIGTSVEYAIYQEFGTYKMKAHPFLVPALKNNTENIKQVIKDSIK